MNDDLGRGHGMVNGVEERRVRVGDRAVVVNVN